MMEEYFIYLFMYFQTKNSGATAVCCVVYNKTLYIAWAGDSQAALIKNGRGVYLTVPHTPERPVSFQQQDVQPFIDSSKAIT